MLTPENYTAKAAEFGKIVLALLEADDTWSNETFNDIANEALRLGLAHPDEHGYFARSEVQL